MRVVVAAVALAVLAACSPDHSEMIPPPPTLVARSTTTEPPNLSGVQLEPVPGRSTTTSVALVGGKATIKGRVVAPGGVVPGAVVRLERVTAEGIAMGDVPSKPDGTFLAPGIQGGRYRLRAWRTPDLAQVQPTIIFVSASEEKSIDLEVERYAGTAVTAAIAPNPPMFSQPANLVVQAFSREVDANGTVVSTALPGVRAELFGAGSWRVDSANPTVTDAGGRARWQVRCNQGGQQALSVLLGDQDSHPLELPACATDGSESSTSTTSAPASSSTTSRR